MVFTPNLFRVGMSYKRHSNQASQLSFSGPIFTAGWLVPYLWVQDVLVSGKVVGMNELGGTSFRTVKPIGIVRYMG